MQALRLVQLRTQLHLLAEQASSPRARRKQVHLVRLDRHRRGVHLFPDEAAREIELSSKAEAFVRLAKSKFRSRFKLDDVDRAYIARVGTETIRRHAEDFVRTKLAPAEPEKDGRQTPMRGHPVFKAMHGSAMCCRGCMEKWWKVPRHRPLTPVQERKAVDFLMEWIARQI